MPSRVQNRLAVFRDCVSLEDACEVEYGTRIRSKDSKGDTYPVYGGGGKTFDWDTFNRTDQCVVSRFAMSPKCVRFVRGKFFLNDSGLTLRVVDKRIDQHFVDCFLIASQDRIFALGRGCAQKNLKVDEFKKMPLPVPSLPEQKRITRQLDLIEELKNNVEDRLSLFDQIVKSHFAEVFGDPLTNPMGWPVGCVSDVSDYWNGLTYRPADVSNRGIIVLRSSNIQNSEIDLADIVRVNVKAKEKNYVQAGDILMCSRNGSAALVGKTAIIPPLAEKMYFGAFMMIIRAECPEYLNAFFKTKAFRAQIACGKTATVNQITCTMMDKVRVPLPPLPLQRKFAKFVAEVEMLKANLRETAATLDQIYRAKQQEYFG